MVFLLERLSSFVIFSLGGVSLGILEVAHRSTRRNLMTEGAL